MATKKIDVPDNMKYVLDRANFELSRASHNVVFLLSIHERDKDDSYLESETFRRVADRALDATIQQWTLQTGVANSLVPGVTKFAFKDNNYLMLYEEDSNG